MGLGGIALRKIKRIQKPYGTRTHLKHAANYSVP